MDFIEEEFSAFKSSVNRMRWFMSTALLISVLIIFHIYLEQFGFQKQQMETVFKSRVAKHSDAVMDCYRDLAIHRQREIDGFESEFPLTCKTGLIMPAELNKIVGKDLEILLHDYSKLEFTRRLTDNTIADSKLGIRKIPLLGVEVPANDFVTVMAIMSFVFVVGVWVNLRGVHASLLNLANRSDPELIKLAQLHTVFVSGVGLTRGNALSNAARGLVFWLPLASIIIASILGFWDGVAGMIGGSHYHLGPNRVLLIHIATSLVISGLHLWIALECYFEVRDIRKIMVLNGVEGGSGS